jgi:hypothetical protein
MPPTISAANSAAPAVMPIAATCHSAGGGNTKGRNDPVGGLLDDPVSNPTLSYHVRWTHLEAFQEGSVPHQPWKRTDPDLCCFGKRGARAKSEKEPNRLHT